MSAEDVTYVETELELDCVNLQLQLSTDSFQDDHPPQKKKCHLGSLFEDVEDKRKEDQEEHAVISSEQKFQEEVEIYKASPRLDFEENPLLWYELNCIKLPILSQLACKYLCVCVTSASSEQLFSAAG